MGFNFWLGSTVTFRPELRYEHSYDVPAYDSPSVDGVSLVRRPRRASSHWPGTLSTISRKPADFRIRRTSVVSPGRRRQR